jgi:hypothetical protein
MPTPSSNPPSDSQSSRSHIFPTCPEDIGARSSPHSRHLQTESDEPSQEMNQHRPRIDEDAGSPILVGASMSDNAADTDTVIDDASASGATSRSMTISPRPLSGVTLQSSPIIGGGDMESLKHVDTDEEVASMVRRHRMSRLGPELPSTGRHSRHVSHPSFHSDIDKGGDSAYLEVWDDGFMAPSMGSEYSNMRVRCRGRDANHGSRSHTDHVLR